MANEKNLKSWKPGQSGNPKGRPQGSLNRSTIAKKWLEAEETLRNPLTGLEELMSQEDAITLAIIHKARKGDVSAYNAVMNSRHGMAKETIDLTQIAEQPLFEDVSEDDSNQEASEA